MSENKGVIGQEENRNFKDDTIIGNKEFEHIKKADKNIKTTAIGYGKSNDMEFTHNINLEDTLQTQRSIVNIRDISKINLAKIGIDEIGLKYTMPLEYITINDKIKKVPKKKLITKSKFTLDKDQKMICKKCNTNNINSIHDKKMETVVGLRCSDCGYIVMFVEINTKKYKKVTK